MSQEHALKALDVPRLDAMCLLAGHDGAVLIESGRPPSIIFDLREIERAWGELEAIDDDAAAALGRELLAAGACDSARRGA